MIRMSKYIMMKTKYVLLSIILIFTYTLTIAQTKYNKIGIASFYADKFEGRKTANGEIYYHVKKTAAHRTLPFGTVVKVTNLENNKYVVVRINDRGPFIDNRIIDLSKSAATDLGFVNKGLAKVRVEVIANTNDLPDRKQKKNVNQQIVYYKLNSELVKPNGKGVQIGSYSENENVIKQIAELKKKFSEEIFVEVASIKKQKVYRIIVGNTNNQNELNKLMSLLKKEFPDCFIVEYK